MNPTDADGYPGTYYGISKNMGHLTQQMVKTICLEVVDNIGNKREHFTNIHSQVSASHTESYLSWASVNHATEKVSITDETVSGRKWISGNLAMSGKVRDL